MFRNANFIHTFFNQLKNAYKTTLSAFLRRAISNWMQFIYNAKTKSQKKNQQSRVSFGARAQLCLYFTSRGESPKIR